MRKTKANFKLIKITGWQHLKEEHRNNSNLNTSYEISRVRSPAPPRSVVFSKKWMSRTKPTSPTKIRTFK
jgi:hypothetical protein